MIKATTLEWTKRVFYEVESRLFINRKFRKVVINEIDLKPDHSILLLQNHFSWWDGFLGSYLNYKYLQRNYYVMVQEDHLSKHRYLRYKGAFSIKKNSKALYDSLNYTTELLHDPSNMVLIFPQGRLQSMHVTNIHLEKGVMRLIEGLPEKCQVIYNAVVLDYFESFKPVVTFNLLDCGSGKSVDLSTLKGRIDQFHQEALKRAIRIQ